MREAPVRVERHALHLLARLGGKITPAVAEVRAEEPGETIEVALALRIGDITTFGVIHHDEVVGVPGRPLVKCGTTCACEALRKSIPAPSNTRS